MDETVREPPQSGKDSGKQGAAEIMAAEEGAW